jgi:ribosome-associated protein
VRPAAQSEPERVDSEAVARLLAEIADSKKAEDVVALDMRSVVGYTDFLVVATARNERQARAIHDDVHLRLKSEHGLLPANVEGESDGQWVLMDYLDAVLHVFVPELRERYRLEVLWAEAPRLELDLQALRDSA